MTSTNCDETLGTLSSASSCCLYGDLGALASYQHHGFQLHRALPFAYILAPFRYACKREAGAKQGYAVVALALPGAGWKKGCSTPSGIWVAVDGARATFILVALVTHRGSDQPPGPSIRSLEFEWFISRPSGVRSSVLHQAPAYRSSDMASLSKCLALLDSG